MKVLLRFAGAALFCLLLLLCGFDPVTSWFTGWGPDWLVNGIASLSLLPHYDAIHKGLLDLAGVTYYLSIIAFMIVATHLVLDNRKT